MPWNTTSVSDQRRQFVIEASLKQESLTNLCKRYGISRQTGYMWCKRYEQEGLTGVQERSRRPQHSPHRVAREVEEAVIGLRHQRPDWGAQKLHHQFRNQYAELPPIAISTVHRILERAGLVQDGDRHRPALGRFERSRP